MDDTLLQALDRLRVEFRAQNVQTENAVNQGFIAIRQEMRSGLDRLNDRMTAGLDDISAKMLAHEREDHEAEKRITKIETDFLTAEKTEAKRVAEASEATRRHGMIAGMVAGFGVMGLGKLVDWFQR